MPSSILVWRTPLTEKPGRPVHRVTKGCIYKFVFFFVCGSSAPVRVEREGGTAAWLVGILGSTKCAGTWTASTTAVMALSESFFKPLIAGDQKASLASLCSSTCSGT